MEDASDDEEMQLQSSSLASFDSSSCPDMMDNFSIKDNAFFIPKDNRKFRIERVHIKDSDRYKSSNSMDQNFERYSSSSVKRSLNSRYEKGEFDTEEVKKSKRK